MINFIKKAISYICNKNKLLLQFGGKKTKIIKIEYDKKIELEFKIIKINKNELEIFISNEIDKDKLTPNSSCLMLQIDKNNQIVYIEGISSDTLNCFQNADFILRKSGNFYLNMTIKMLKKYKDKFNINRISLLDNAKVKPYYGKSYNLSQFKLLTEGNTFYEKFGFKINKKYKTQHLINKKIIGKLKVKDVKLDNLIKNITHEKFTDDYINNIINFLNKNKNEKLIKIMNIIFKENRNKFSDLLYSLIVNQILIMIEKLYIPLNDQGNKNKIYYERLKPLNYYMKI